MANVNIRTVAECEAEPFLSWDTIWVQEVNQISFGGHGDFAIAGTPQQEPNNQVGLQACAAIETAILIQLFTDKRAPEDIVLPKESQDRRGWLGDGFDLREDLYETEMGSLLWTLERGHLNDTEIPLLAKQYCVEALQPLIDQGLVARFVVDTEADLLHGALLIGVEAYSQDGSKIYDQKFSQIWQQQINRKPANTYIDDILDGAEDIPVSSNQLLWETSGGPQGGILLEKDGQTTGGVLEIEGPNRT